MQIYIDRGGERYGPYGIEDVNTYLANGTLLPTDLAWQDGMTDWMPISQIPGVVMPEGSAAIPIPPSQPGPNGNKKKILIGIGAGMGLLALVAGIWFFFIREAGEKEQPAKNSPNSNTPAKSAKEKAETKGTPSKNADKKPTVKSMLAIVGQPLTKDEESFAGRRKGEYQLGPDEPMTHVEAIYRKDHTSSIFYLHHASDDNGKLIQGEFRRELAHGIWQKKGDHLYFLDLVFNDKKNPEKEQMVIEAVLIEASKAKFVYKIPESKDEEEIILESIFNEESVEKFEHPEMRAYNSADALQSFDLLRAYRNAKERPPED